MYSAPTCANCGSATRPIAARGLCRPCYMRERRAYSPRLTDAELLNAMPDWLPRFTTALLKARCDLTVDSCWPWAGTLSKGDYGMFSIKGHSYGAHRLSWMVDHQSVPDGDVVMHHCDNPRCVNPSCLTDGSYSENVQDMIEKGRDNPWPKGKLRPDQSGDKHWKRR